MDTKSKKNNIHSFARVVAAVLMMASVATFFHLAFSIENAGYLKYLDFVTNDTSTYLPSFGRAAEMYEAHMNLEQLLTKYKSEAYIRSGALINERQLRQNAYNYFQSNYGYEFYNDEDGDARELSKEEALQRLEQEEPDYFQWQRQQSIDQSLIEYFAYINMLNQGDRFLYYASDGENVFCNAPSTSVEYFTGSVSPPRPYLIFENGRFRTDELFSPSFVLGISPFATTNYQIYVTLSDSYLASQNADYANGKRMCNQLVLYSALLAGVFLLCLVYLLYAAGKKAGHSGVFLTTVDRLYTDLNLALLIFCTIMGLLLIFELEPLMNGMVSCGLSALVTLIDIVLLCSLAKHVKNRSLLRRSLIYTILFKGGRWLYRKVRSWLSRIATSLRDSLSDGYPLMIALFQPKFVRQLKAIAGSVNAIKNGDTPSPAATEEYPPLRRLNQDIATLGAGLNKAVEKEIKAERMKAELITNVSHDLKTPLTSIINYVDLLSKETLQPDYANDYVKILVAKSDRLKTLTADLFEISKVRSGNIQVTMEEIDLRELLNQCIAEYEQGLAAASLTLKLQCPADKILVRTDGKKLSRVIDNLMNNILKYSMEHTRVYISVETDDEHVSLAFKNIAGYEMNFSVQDITERFVRGDSSRTTQGSGLGLSIAESYVAACGGSFAVTVDGDLFKATVTLPK